MDQYITVTSGRSPSRFTSNFNDAINLSGDYEIAVKSVFHGPLCNVTSDNNTFAVSKGDNTVYFTIPEGFYSTPCEILGAAHRELMKTYSPDYVGPEINLKESPSLTVSPQGYAILKLSMRAEVFTFDKKSKLFELVGCMGSMADQNKIEAEVLSFQNRTSCGFLYSNIVTNSIINESSARLVTAIPIISKKGYNYYEFTNPCYKRVSVSAFTDLSFVLTDQNGRDLYFDQYFHPDSDVIEYPTIINLHIRSVRKV